MGEIDRGDMVGTMYVEVEQGYRTAAQAIRWGWGRGRVRGRGGNNREDETQIVVCTAVPFYTSRHPCKGFTRNL